MTRAAAALALAAFALAAAPRVARGYTRSRNSAGVVVAWPSPQLVVHVPVLTADRPVSLLSSDDVLAATDAAVAIWSHDQVACTGVEMSAAVGASRDALAEKDDQNNVIFRVDSWSPQVFDEMGLPLGDYEPNQLALTSAWVTKSGKILDADIEINVFNYPVWEVSGDMSRLVSDAAFDLQNTLSHELGHVLGLDHSCWDPVTGPRPIDGDVPRPACADDPTLAEATMAPTAFVGDVGKRVLHDDDRKGICDVYPFDPGGGCAAAGGAAGTPALLAVALALLAAVHRGRRARPAQA
jgi:hypothetical protein